MTKIRSPISLLKEPKFVSAMFATAYALMMLIGIVIIMQTPTELVILKDMPLVIIVSFGFIVGGGLGALSLHGGEWWIERAGIWLILGGLAAYGITVWHFEGSDSEKVIRTLLTIAFTAHFIARLYKIRDLTLDPTK